MRIAIADDEKDMRDYYCKMLPRLGHEVVCACANGRELVEQCRIHRPELVITDIRMPLLDGIDAAKEIYRQFPVPVILVSAYHDHGLIERAENDHVLAFLGKPIKLADLEPAIALASRRFEQFEALRHEAEDLRQALADRTLLERAKGLLMKGTGIDEAEAFCQLLRLASEKNQKLVEIARSLIAANEPLSN